MDTFTKQLCGAVRKHPVLYDCSFTKNSKKEVIEEAWKSVAYECNQAISYVKSSWYTIYTNFMASLNKVKTSCELYVLEDLKFLLPFVTKTIKDRETQILLASNLSQQLESNANGNKETPFLAFKKKHFIVETVQNNKRKVNENTIYCIVGENNTQLENDLVTDSIEIPITEKGERETADEYSLVDAIQPPHKKLALVIKALPKTNEMATTKPYYDSIIIEDSDLVTNEIDDSNQNNVTISETTGEESLINQSAHIQNVEPFEPYINTENQLFDFDGTKDSIIKIESNFNEKDKFENSKAFNDANTQCDYEFDDEDFEFIERVRKWQLKMDARQKILFRKGVYQAYFDVQNKSLICEASKDDVKSEIGQSGLRDFNKTKSVELRLIPNLVHAEPKQKPVFNSTSTNRMQVTASPMQPKISNKKNLNYTNEFLTDNNSNSIPQTTAVNAQLKNKTCRILRSTPITLPHKKLYEMNKPLKSLSYGNDVVIHTKGNNLQNSMGNKNCANENIFNKSAKLEFLKNESSIQKKTQDANATLNGKYNILNFKETGSSIANNIATTISSTGAIITMKNVTNNNMKLFTPKLQEETVTRFLNVPKLLQTPMNCKKKVVSPKIFHICNVSTNCNKASLIEISDKLNTETQPISPNIHLIESEPKTVQQHKQIQNFQTIDYKDTANCDNDILPNETFNIDQVNSNDNMDYLITSDFETFIKNELRTLEDEYA